MFGGCRGFLAGIRTISSLVFKSITETPEKLLAHRPWLFGGVGGGLSDGAPYPDSTCHCNVTWYNVNNYGMPPLGCNPPRRQHGIAARFLAVHSHAVVISPFNPA